MRRKTDRRRDRQTDQNEWTENGRRTKKGGHWVTGWLAGPLVDSTAVWRAGNLLCDWSTCQRSKEGGASSQQWEDGAGVGSVSSSLPALRHTPAGTHAHARKHTQLWRMIWRANQSGQQYKNNNFCSLFQCFRLIFTAVMCSCVRLCIVCIVFEVMKYWIFLCSFTIWVE